MKKTLLATTILCAFIVGCTGAQTISRIPVGWQDEDTYTVTAVGRDENDAVDRARHRILRDIVDVRVRNESRYRDIEMIREEFKVPLQTGTVLSRENVPEGILIYFQIRDKGLKKKFERK